MHRTRSVLLTALFAFITIACGPKATSNAAAKDQSLTADIQAKLAANDATRAANVKVAVAGGVVTLSGDVPNSDAALQAMTVANNTAGIRSVNNQMRVADSAAAPAPPPLVSATSPAGELPTALPPGATAPMSAPVASMPPQSPPVPVTITIPSGRRVSIRMIDGIDTAHNRQGEIFRASLNAPITQGDRVIVAAGAPVTVLLAEARGAGRLKGRSELELRLTGLVYRGERVPVESGVYEARGKARGKQSAIRTGIGAAAGALIGGLAGGGKGAGIGAAAGGGAGVGFQLLTHGQQIKIPPETEITFSLAAPLILAR